MAQHRHYLRLTLPKVRLSFQIKHMGKKGNCHRSLQEVRFNSEGATKLTSWERRTWADINNIISSSQNRGLYMERGQKEAISEYV